MVIHRAKGFAFGETNNTIQEKAGQVEFSFQDINEPTTREIAGKCWENAREHWVNPVGHQEMLGGTRKMTGGTGKMLGGTGKMLGDTRKMLENGAILEGTNKMLEALGKCRDHILPNQPFPRGCLFRNGQYQMQYCAPVTRDFQNLAGGIQQNIKQDFDPYSLHYGTEESGFFTKEGGGVSNPWMHNVNTG